jgi:putative methionine-R-sulfoxide reductase with GAF domain
MSILHTIVDKIADREGVEPTELDPPLNDVVNVEALEELITDTETQHEGPGPLVEFVYVGYTVKIGADRNVSISEASTIDEFSGDIAGGSLENASAKLGHHENAMKDVADCISARERAFVPRLAGLLEVVRKVLRMESATLSYVDDGSYVFEAVDVAEDVQIHAGEVVSLEDTVCKRVVTTEQTLVLSNVEADAPELANSAFAVSSYLGVPVFVDGDVYGTLCFYDPDVREEEFSEWDLAFVELLSNWVGSELERRNRERAVHASTTERPYAAN